MKWRFTLLKKPNVEPVKSTGETLGPPQKSVEETENTNTKLELLVSTGMPWTMRRIFW